MDIVPLIPAGKEEKMLIARYDRLYLRRQSLCQHAGNAAIKTAENLKHLGLEKVGLLVGWLHDLGKSQKAWQDALEKAKRRYLSGDETHRPLDVPHASVSAQHVYSLLKSRAVTAYERACLQIICLAVYAHHGYLMDVLSIKGEDVFSRLVSDSPTEDQEAHELFFQEVISKEDVISCFVLACEEVKALLADIPDSISHYTDKKNKNKALYLMLALIVREIYAALVDADRLDAARFEGGQLSVAKEKEPPDWALLIDSLGKHLSGFEQKKTIDRLRREISDSCARAALLEEPLQALHAPTGGGKTLAGLRWALIRAQEKKRKRIFYVVTYTTILDQVYDDYQKALAYSQASVDLLLHHSNIIPDSQDARDKSSQKGLWEKQSLLAERWDSDIILTTQVQLFNALFLGTAKAARRLRGLSDSVIIFDEVQTVPPKLSHLFNAAINYLTGVCHCDVLLSSATQPPFDAMAYPLPKVRSIFDDPNALFGRMRRVELIDERGRGAMSALETARFACDQQRKWKSCLIVLNTRSAARKVYDALKETRPEDLELHLLSNDLCPAHRKKIIKKLRDHDDPCICVSTQLIECGVDLSFGCVIRSLAGADNIWQTAGRCNRHDDGSIHPVYIILCAEENLVQLREIRNAQAASAQVLHHLENADALQMPSAMEEYFRQYFHNEEDQLSFPVIHEGSSSTMVGLLSDNPAGAKSYWENNPGVKLKWLLTQAFGTAGKSFSVIDSPATALIVPYDKGKGLIEELNGSITLEKEKGLLRQAQLYSINVYSYRLRALLDQKAVFMLPCGAYALRPEWYDSDKRGLLEDPEFNVNDSFV